MGTEAATLFKQAERVQIVACGTSYHAGIVARYWIEEITEFLVKSKLPVNIVIVNMLVTQYIIYNFVAIG